MKRYSFITRKLSDLGLKVMQIVTNFYSKYRCITQQIKRSHFPSINTSLKGDCPFHCRFHLKQSHLQYLKPDNTINPGILEQPGNNSITQQRLNTLATIRTPATAISEQIARSELLPELDLALLVKYLNYPDQYDAIIEFRNAIATT